MGTGCSHFGATSAAVLSPFDGPSWAAVELASRGGLNTPPQSLLDSWQATVDDESTAAGALSFAWRVADTLRRKGHAPTALQLTERAAAREVRGPERLLLAGVAATCEMDIAAPTDHLSSERLVEIVHDLVAAADAELTGEDSEQRVADLAGLALEVMFHRSRHTDVELSPLADPHHALLEAWHASAVRQRLDAAPVPRDRMPVAPGRSVLTVTWDGSSFLPRLAQDISSAGATVTPLVLKPTSWPRVGPVRNLVRIRLAQAAGRTASGKPPASVMAAVAAADTVVVDWCNHVAVWLPAILRDDQRLVIRLHSIEALSADPQLVPWHRVDQLIVVSEPLRRIVAAVVPQTALVPVAMVPPMAVTLTVIYSPRDGTYEPTAESSVVVWLTPSDPQAVPELLQAAKDARTQAGYSDRDRRLGGKDFGGDFWIECDINANQYKPGATQNPVVDSPLLTVQIQLTAPHLEP